MSNVFYNSYGMKCISEKADRCVYQAENAHHGLMTVFHICPGIDAILCNFYEKYTVQIKENKTGKHFYCISYGIDGIYESEIKKNRCLYVAPGTVEIIKNVNHNASAETMSSTFHGFNIMIFSEELDKKLMEFYREHFGLRMEEVLLKLDRVVDIGFVTPDTELLHVTEELYTHMLDENIGMIRLKVIEYLYSIACERFQVNSSGRTFSRKQVEATKAIKERMTADLSKHYTIKELCQDAGISETIFKECFKTLYQHTPYSFVKTSKMYQAAEYMKKKDMSLTEIAEKLGYENPSNFSRTFLSVFGILPSEYRKNICIR